MCELPGTNFRTREYATGNAAIEPLRGDYTEEIFELHSELFQNNRGIRVLLPPGYADSQDDYPVFYFNDGVASFRENRPGLPAVATKLVNEGAIPPTIFIGIDNGASTDKTTNPLRDRAREFLPYPDVGPTYDDEAQPPNPIGKLYPYFVVNEVMPAVAARYRISQDPMQTGIGGHSYGGTAALYTALVMPGRFGKLMLESTPLWMGAEKQLFRDIENAQQWPARIIIGRGTRETEDVGINKIGSANLAMLMESIQRTSPSTCAKLYSDEDAEHDYPFWNARLDDGLTYLLGETANCD